MKLKKARIMAALLAAMAVMAASGCGEDETSSSSVADEIVAEITTEVSTTTAESETEPATEPELKIIGQEMKGDMVHIVALTNETGKNITEFSVKKASEEEYPENMLSDGSFEDNEERILYYEGKDGEYTVKIVFDDDSEAELHAFPLADIEEGTIKLEGDTAYLVYMSRAEKSEVNTKDDEQKLAEGEDADTPVQEELPAATDAPAYTPEPTPTEPPATQPTEPEPAPTDPPAVNDTPAADPNEGCVGDGALFW